MVATVLFTDPDRKVLLGGPRCRPDGVLPGSDAESGEAPTGAGGAVTSPGAGLIAGRLPDVSEVRDVVGARCSGGPATGPRLPRWAVVMMNAVRILIC